MERSAHAGRVDRGGRTDATAGETAPLSSVRRTRAFSSTDAMTFFDSIVANVAMKSFPASVTKRSESVAIVPKSSGHAGRIEKSGTVDARRKSSAVEAPDREEPRSIRGDPTGSSDGSDRAGIRNESRGAGDEELSGRRRRHEKCDKSGCHPSHSQ